MFEKYGSQYGLDPLMLAALGYQESRLDQNAHSHVGAFGIMQLMPSTGALMKVGDIAITENNINTGTKYMNQSKQQRQLNYSPNEMKHLQKLSIKPP